MFENASPPQAPRKRRYLTWGGISPVPHGEPVPSPNPFHGLSPADVVHTGEVTINFDGFPVVAQSYATLSER